MRDITRLRFEALAAYCRNPHALQAGQEIRWLQAYDEEILIVVIRDRNDGDYASILLAKDLKERYRWVEMTAFFDSPEKALSAAPEKIEKTHTDIANQRIQGDEKGKPVDFFTPIVSPEKLNIIFSKINSFEGYSPAVELMKPMMRWHEDADGNFVEQFQTTGFNARLWELYIFATLVEAGYALDKKSPIPDFCAENIFGKIFIEATTINPSHTRDGQLIAPPPIESPAQIREFLLHYMPIKYAGPLTTKLGKKYWEKEHVKGNPLILAIADFHQDTSISTSANALPTYLYGYDWQHKTINGKLIIEPLKISKHIWGEKTINSSFFSLPGAENISAVISNSSATISKFNRMGALAGFGSSRVQMLRVGTASNPTPNADMPIHFEHNVKSPDYHETWIEGMDIYHNQNAKNPLDPRMFPGAAHHKLSPDGNLISLIPEWHPISSHTFITTEEKPKDM